jgi:hypothetical protein
MRLINYRRWLSIALLFLGGLCNSAMAAVIISAGEEYNYTFDFSSDVLINGPGRAGWDIIGRCLTQTHLAVTWIQDTDVANTALGGHLCSSSGGRFASGGGYAIIPDSDGIFTLSFKVSSGSYQLTYLAGTFGWPPRIDPTTQVAITSVPIPKSIHLLSLAIVMMVLALSFRSRKPWKKCQYQLIF